MWAQSPDSRRLQPPRIKIVLLSSIPLYASATPGTSEGLYLSTLYDLIAQNEVFNDENIHHKERMLGAWAHVSNPSQGIKHGQHVPKMWTSYPPNLSGLSDSIVFWG